MRESDIIAALSAIHGNVPYMADAEVLPFADCSLLFSMDSFSEREDFLHGLAPEMIGHQIACAACSDILACGAVPEWLLQNWCYDQRHDIGFYKHVASGIEYVLKQYGARCVGGDIGTASEWCWTATAVGHSKAPVTRVASARVDFDLYSTGPMGVANAAVFCGRPLPLFALRKPVPQGALFATDTSGGFLDAIENFRRVNHGMSIEVDADALVSPAAIEMLPPKAEPGWTLVGGVGEYELVFAVPKGTAVADAIRIGSGHFIDSLENDFRLNFRGRRGRICSAPPDYRGIEEKEWLAATASHWESLFA